MMFQLVGSMLPSVLKRFLVYYGSGKHNLLCLSSRKNLSKRFSDDRTGGGSYYNMKMAHYHSFFLKKHLQRHVFFLICYFSDTLFHGHLDSAFFERKYQRKKIPLATSKNNSSANCGKNLDHLKLC